MDSTSIRQLIRGKQHLVENYSNLDEQLQPNGFDLTLAEVDTLQDPGQIGPSNDQRILATPRPLHFPPDGYLNLAPGPYLITLNEVLNLPRDVMALGKPRSSLLRCGVTIHNAVWDAGYRGRSQALLVVYNPKGFRLGHGARVLQLVFFRLEKATDRAYAGRYLNENL
ncbi:MAG: deoxyuridine 5'-triphosphate nucleotidohydrolase [Chloroflexi bacterium]|nr:deoxyuridine 5'-triphosphate nucleotidohydrolase [Chloroflexota bacterium]